MWKKVLAWISIPFALLFSLSMVRVTLNMMVTEPEGTAAYRFAYIVGQCLAAFMMGALLYLWWRWIGRVLKRTDLSP